MKRIRGFCLLRAPDVTSPTRKVSYHFIEIKWHLALRTDSTNIPGQNKGGSTIVWPCHNFSPRIDLDIKKTMGKISFGVDRGLCEDS